MAQQQRRCTKGQIISNDTMHGTQQTQPRLRTLTPTLRSSRTSSRYACWAKLSMNCRSGQWSPTRNSASWCSIRRDTFSVNTTVGLYMPGRAMMCEWCSIHVYMITIEQTYVHSALHAMLHATQSTAHTSHVPTMLAASFFTSSTCVCVVVLVYLSL